MEPASRCRLRSPKRCLIWSGAMLTKALTAWQNASGQEITAESIAALDAEHADARRANRLARAVQPQRCNQPGKKVSRGKSPEEGR